MYVVEKLLSTDRHILTTEQGVFKKENRDRDGNFNLIIDKENGTLSCGWVLQDATTGHPLEAMDKSRIPNEFAFKMESAGRIYGSAFVMRMKTEVAMLSQVRAQGSVLFTKAVMSYLCWITRLYMGGLIVF